MTQAKTTTKKAVKAPKPNGLQPMREVRVEKLTLNVGAGRDAKVLDKGVLLLKHVTGIDPVKTVTQKRIANWGLRPGLPIGVKITLRGKEAEELAARLLQAKSSRLKPRNLDENGNISFGVLEYVDVPKVNYNPDIGMMGFQVSITLARPGYRIKSRKLRKSRIPRNHRVSRDDTVNFLEKKYHTKVEA